MADKSLNYLMTITLLKFMSDPLFKNLEASTYQVCGI